jgi:hypothetical protein
MTLARVVSRIFEPMILIPLLVSVAVARSGFPASRLFSVYAFFLLGILVPIIIFRLWLLKTKGVVWDIPKRRDRILPFATLAGFGLLGYVVVFGWGNANITNFIGFLLVWFVGLLVITTRVKISGHVATSALVSLLLVRWYGASALPALLAIPLVSWARVAGKNHTTLEVIFGFLFSLVLVGAAAQAGWI